MDAAQELSNRILARDSQSLPINNLKLTEVKCGETNQLIQQLNQEHGFHLTPPWAWNNQASVPVEQLKSIDKEDYNFYQSNLQPLLAARLDFQASIKKDNYGLIEDYLNQKLRLAVGPLIIIPNNEELLTIYPFVYSWKINFVDDDIVSAHLVTALSEYRKESKLYGDLYNHIYQPVSETQEDHQDQVA
jgi:hypothetical protein